MPIPAPTIDWPHMLDEAGPLDDPAILLEAKASVGGVMFELRALRHRKGHRGPDFRADVPMSQYRETLDSLLDDVEDLAGAIELSTVAIGGADYLVWMVPAARE